MPLLKQFELTSGNTINQLLDRQMIRFIRHPMNFLDAASTNHYSTRAAAAAAATSDAGRFQITHALFEHQPPEGGPGLTDHQLIALGRAIGVTDPSFASEIQEGRIPPWPSFVTEHALARGIGGTPSVFVQGIPVPARPDLIVAAVERVAGYVSGKTSKALNSSTFAGLLHRHAGQHTSATTRLPAGA